MFSALFHNSPLILFPVVGLALFIVVFASVVVRTFSRGPDAYQRVAELPLASDGGDHV